MTEFPSPPYLLQLLPQRFHFLLQNHFLSLKHYWCPSFEIIFSILLLNYLLHIFFFCSYLDLTLFLALFSFTGLVANVHECSQSCRINSLRTRPQYVVFCSRPLTSVFRTFWGTHRMAVSFNCSRYFSPDLLSSSPRVNYLPKEEAGNAMSCIKTQVVLKWVRAW